MNKYYNHFKSTVAGRDYIFHNVRKLLGGRPAKIMEIGSSRDLSFEARFSDGWSSYFWLEYIQIFGGQLDIFDIDQNALDNCKKLFEGSETPNINFICDDAVSHIKDNYDLIFLDGSDCPNEMLSQFEKIDRTKSIILCDDFNSKGSLLSKKHKDFLLFYLANTPFQMAVYPKLG